MSSSMNSFLKVSSLLAVAGVLALAPAFAKDPADATTKVTTKVVSAFPECLAKLELTADQKQKIQEVVSETDVAHAKIWSQFSARYVQMIGVEAAMLTAIEDHLTEPQLVQVRTHRNRTAHRARMLVKGTKPATTTVEKELAKDGVTLTDEQAAASDKVQEKYHANLHVLHHSIQGLHAQLLALEADKLAQIEQVLTKEQLAELRTNREKAPAVLKLAITADEPAKDE